jgi:hypothetical protein
MHWVGREIELMCEREIKWKKQHPKFFLYPSTTIASECYANNFLVHFICNFFSLPNCTIFFSWWCTIVRICVWFITYGVGEFFSLPWVSPLNDGHLHIKNIFSATDLSELLITLCVRHLKYFISLFPQAKFFCIKPFFNQLRHTHLIKEIKEN